MTKAFLQSKKAFDVYVKNVYLTGTLLKFNATFRFISELV
ncbi:hypothetical protein M2254_000229 [Chryseobacterium sp. BIGb0186]|nr:hypothetical protein [Chryseobacterium sp. JUb44]MDH6208645.1 hypothetical protein [Chryseobacterium sp. BIGb0186]